MKRLFENRAVRNSGLLILSLIALAIAAPFISPYDVHDFDLAGGMNGPSLHHWFGQDQDGGDVLTLLFYGARVSLSVALVSVTLALVVGLAVGVLAGFCGGRVDGVCLWVMDLFLAFPGLLLAIGISAVQKEPRVATVVLALSLTGWVSYARIARLQVYSIKQLPFMEAARSLGVRPILLVLRHLLPNLWGPLLIQVSFGIAGAMIAESTLSFLGLGVPPSVPSWGAMLDYGAQYLLIAPHLSIFPGVAIMLAVLSFHFMGDGLRDVLDPRTPVEKGLHQ